MQYRFVEHCSDESLRNVQRLTRRRRFRGDYRAWKANKEAARTLNRRCARSRVTSIPK